MSNEKDDTKELRLHSAVIIEPCPSCHTLHAILVQEDSDNALEVASGRSIVELTSELIQIDWDEAYRQLAYVEKNNDKFKDVPNMKDVEKMENATKTGTAVDIKTRH